MPGIPGGGFMDEELKSLVFIAIGTMRTVANDLARHEQTKFANWARCNEKELLSAAKDLEDKIRG